MNYRIRFFLAAMFLFSNPSFSQDGSLDLSFGNGGKVVTSIRNSNDYCNAMALQPDGKIVLAGNAYNAADSDCVLLRYNPDGTLDTGFGSLGIVANDLGSTGEMIRAIALQPDGKIVVAGKTDQSNYSRFLVMRYLNDGTIDTSFGNSGMSVTAFGNYNAEANALAIQPDGKIILTGMAYTGPNEDFAVARYNIDGTPDETFGTAGILTTAIGPGYDYAYAVALQHDGKIVVGGSAYTGMTFDFVLVRYNQDGSLDVTFDTDGKATTDFTGNGDYLYSIAIQNDNKIVAAGNSGSFPYVDFAVARYNENGSLDTSFDGDGKTTTYFRPYDDLAFSVAIQNDNKILVAGYSSVSVGNNKDFAVARYNSNGTLDFTFDQDGRVLTPVANADLNDIATSVLVQSDGKILAAGSTFSGNVTNNDILLVRYNSTLLANANFQVSEQVAIFPNPVCSHCTLYLDTFFDHVTVNVLNTTGQQIMTLDDFSGDSIPLSPADFKPGLYFIQCAKQGKVIYTSKFFVKN